MENRIEIQYKDSFVAYVDVLGFSNIVNNPSPESKEKLNTYFTVIDSVISELKIIDAKREIGYITISDTIFLSIPQATNYEENLNNIRQLCIAIGSIQRSLAVADIWVRGAISSGQAHFDSERNQIVGPALVAAYNLENSIAKYPRVILDSKIIRQFNLNASQFIEAMNNANNNGLGFINWGSSVIFCWENQIGLPNTMFSRDIPLFIDYLCPIVEQASEELSIIIDNLEKNLYSDTKQYEKYRWVADYLTSRFMTAHEDTNSLQVEIRITSL